MLDVKRGDAEAAASYADVLLYISLFPQLIAGPIVRYSDVAAEIKQRTVTTEDIAAGLRRFCFGMGKRCLLRTRSPTRRTRFCPGRRGDKRAHSMAWRGMLFDADIL